MPNDFFISNGRYIDCLSLTFATNKSKKLKLHNKHYINPLNAELNPICHLLALLGGATIVVVSRLRVKREKT